MTVNDASDWLIHNLGTVMYCIIQCHEDYSLCLLSGIQRVGTVLHSWVPQIVLVWTSWCILETYLEFWIGNLRINLVILGKFQTKNCWKRSNYLQGSYLVYRQIKSLVYTIRMHCMTRMSLYVLYFIHRFSRLFFQWWSPDILSDVSALINEEH